MSSITQEERDRLVEQLAASQARVAELGADLRFANESIQQQSAWVDAAREEARQAQARLPDGMKHCTIVFRECELGHGWLTATNWIDHGCPHCKLAASEARVQELDAAMRKVSDIRDSIVGMQGFNFSEHAYPLVAVLDAAGYPGVGYDVARENLGTLIEQRDAACEEARQAQALLRVRESESLAHCKRADEEARQARARAAAPGPRVELDESEAAQVNGPDGCLPECRRMAGAVKHSPACTHIVYPPMPASEPPPPKCTGYCADTGCGERCDTATGHTCRPCTIARAEEVEAEFNRVVDEAQPQSAEPPKHHLRRFETAEEHAARIEAASTKPAAPPRKHHLAWNGTEWVDERCGCRYHPDDDNGSHGGAPHVHRCEKHREPPKTCAWCNDPMGCTIHETDGG